MTGRRLTLWLRRAAQRRLYLAQRQHLGTARRTVLREIQLPDRSSILLAQQLLGPSRSPSRELIAREQAHAVRRAIARLATKDREVVLMRMFERLSSEEIACVLDITPAAVRQRYGRALLRLRKILERAGFTGSEP